MSRRSVAISATFAIGVLVAGCGCSATTKSKAEGPRPLVRYMEIVSGDVDAQCALLEQVNAAKITVQIAERVIEQIEEEDENLRYVTLQLERYP